MKVPGNNSVTGEVPSTGRVFSSHSDPSSLVARWALCGLAIVFCSFVLMQLPPRMVVNKLGVTATRTLGAGVFALGLFYTYAVIVNPVTRQFLKGRV